MTIVFLNTSNQYLAKYQKPYSFDALSEPTIEIIDTLTVLDSEAKPTIQDIASNNPDFGKTNNSDSQVSKVVSSGETSNDLLDITAYNGPPKIERFTLSNGIQVVNLYVENSKDVGIFSYLPLCLAIDGKAKSQWSNLIMRLSVGSTRNADFKTSSAETMANNMRFEFLGNTDTWKQGLDMHEKWLSGQPFSEESLDKAVKHALAEFDYIERNLSTHKFAHAAWNQVFRHGETDIRMQRDIQSAKLSEIQKYRDQYLIQADRVLMCVIGGVDHNTLKTVMENQLGTIHLPEIAPPQATIAPQKLKNQAATWDVSVTHYMETYAIPTPENVDYPALYIASVLLQSASYQNFLLKELTGYVVCGVDLVTPENVYFYVSASLKSDTEIEEVKERIRLLIRSLKQLNNHFQIPIMARLISNNHKSPPDIRTLMNNKPKNITETHMLLQLGVSWGMLEYHYGENLQQLANAFADVSADDVVRVANQYLTEDNRQTLVLTPRIPE